MICTVVVVIAREFEVICETGARLNLTGIEGRKAAVESRVGLDGVRQRSMVDPSNKATVSNRDEVWVKSAYRTVSWETGSIVNPEHGVVLVERCRRRSAIARIVNVLRLVRGTTFAGL